MGGSAFAPAAFGFTTPRMPPHIYREVKDSCHSMLRKIYVHVDTPIEGPGKADFGDIDILVAVETCPPSKEPHPPGNAVERTTVEQLILIGEALKARASIMLSPPISANFAIPWPSSDHEHSALPDADRTRSDTDKHMGEKLIQVDVRICTDERQLNWALFKHAHSDIWNLLGSTIRPYGLTADEQALWLRISEIEKYDRKQAKVKLTEDPVEVIRFLGMEYGGFWTQPFVSAEALYEYVTTCRLFIIRDEPAAGCVRDNQLDCALAVGGAEGRKKLRSNDRRRMNTRPIYRRWIDEFIPRLLAEGWFICKDPETTVSQMRATVRDEALERFSVEDDYKERLKAWRLKRETEFVKGVIKDLVPRDLEIRHRATLISAFKKIILEGDRSFGVSSASPLKNPGGVYDMELTRAFVAEKWEELDRVAWAAQLQRSREAMKAKAAKMESSQGI
ncbi:hypothetical protein B0H66DRAFT_572404 [Apodospora peruviana]|uniref:Uncharacterized protein n=1 Tax=Apodospora peruviana TaxID=516989 RepID=A0AAE0MF81_9PEZI|nr:hypothetical protein B0H66DRAFT_572404 [Apodospora peruviana]